MFAINSFFKFNSNSFFVTTSKALVTTSVAPVTSSNKKLLGTSASLVGTSATLVNIDRPEFVVEGARLLGASLRATLLQGLTDSDSEYPQE